MLTGAPVPARGRDGRRLAEVLGTVNRFVPFYRQLWQQAGIDIERLDLPAEFQRLPIVQKADFRRFPLEERLDRRFKIDSLAKLLTSGSSGQPFEVYVDRASLWRRQRRTVAGLWHSGYRPGQRLLWLKHLPSGRFARPSLLRRMARLAYINANVAPETVLEQYRAQRADVVYGALSALALLAEGVGQGRRPSPSIIVGFGEQLTASVRKLVATQLGADVTDFYGTTEVGLIAVRRPDEAYYKTLQPDLLLEYLPVEDAPGFERLVVTALGGGVMPFIRYDAGDLVRRDHSRPDQPIVAMAGRELDFLTMRDGRRISPHRLDDALFDLPGLLQYRIVQQADYSVDLYVMTARRPAADVIRDARAALTNICGPGLVLRVLEQTEITSSSAAKLRVIQSHVRAALRPG